MRPNCSSLFLSYVMKPDKLHDSGQWNHRPNHISRVNPDRHGTLCQHGVPVNLALSIIYSISLALGSKSKFFFGFLPLRFRIYSFFFALFIYLFILSNRRPNIRFLSFHLSTWNWIKCQRQARVDCVFVSFRVRRNTFESSHVPSRIVHEGWLF